MKRVTTFLLIAVSATLGFSQESFHEDSRAFDVKLDFGAYQGTIKDNQADTSAASAAASIILSPQMSWAVTRVLSLGGSFAFSHYQVTSPASLNGLDATFLFDVHFVRAPKTDMMIGLKVGIAGIRLNPKDGSENVYGSMGLTSDLHLMARFYVSEHTAIIANLGFPGYVFNKFGKNLQETYTIKWNGACLGAGIAIKLANQSTSGSARNK